ncbi:MAG TPA: type II toxin-antitoxin system PemK/MazF family toxin [Acidimicrobiales bacterium]
MVIHRGEVYWIDLGEPVGSRPANRRPVLVVSDDQFNASNISTVIVAVMTGNTLLEDLPGNVLVPKGAASLPRDSVVNVSSVATINKNELGKRVGTVPESIMRTVDAGLRLSMNL